MEINLDNFKIDLSQNIEVEQLRYMESRLRLKERQLSKQIRKLQELQTEVINKRQKLTALRDAKEVARFLKAKKWERAIQLIADRLRLKERAIGEQSRKLQELQTQVIKKRQSLTAVRDGKERELFERAGKVQYLRSRKTPQKQGQAIPRETKWERAIRLVSEGKLEEAKALVGK